jgi:hypothetical protein
MTQLKKRKSEKEHILDCLSNLDPTSEQYGIAVRNLEILAKSTPNKWPSMDTVIVAGTTVLEILLVLNHEHLNVITTKAFGLILKGRV